MRQISRNLGRPRDGVASPVDLRHLAAIMASDANSHHDGPAVAGQDGRKGFFHSTIVRGLRSWSVRKLLANDESCARPWRRLSLKMLCSDPSVIREVWGAEIAASDPPAPPIPMFLQSALIESSMLFDRAWYLGAYRNVALAGADPLEHYLQHGIGEGCNPNRLFDTRWYVSAYPDAPFERMHPLTHYILEGARSGHETHPLFSTANIARETPAVAERDLTPLARYLIRHRSDQDWPRFNPYAVFRAARENERDRERSRFKRHIEVMTIRPRFLIMIDGDDPAGFLATRESLARQTYEGFEIFGSIAELSGIADDGSGLAQFMWLDAGDILHRDALYELASALNARPDLELVYFDHEVEADDGGLAPMHKPAWSPDYLESLDYIGPAACFAWSRAKEVLFEAACRYDFTLRFTDSPGRIANLDHVLLRRAAPRTPIAGRIVADIRALEGRLTRTGRRGVVTCVTPDAQAYDLDIELRENPLVSIVIPTAARVIDYEGKRIDLIVACVESIVAKSSYKNIEFIIVDNGDFDRDRLKHIGIERITFLTYTLPEVNIARKINLGASRAKGEFLIILNDDIEVLASDWIERMLAHFEKPHVGLVGGKLLYPDMTIQHAGVVLCGGDPHHVRRGSPRDDLGYAFSTRVARDCLAVTGAMTMVRAREFRNVGGYSENLPIDFNDIDFSLALGKLGFSVVYEPKAELVHYESVSAVKPPRPQDHVLFHQRWTAYSNDPYFNGFNFDHNPPTYALSYGGTKRL